ncbi:GNAT family N-acetyltransferase [Shouchella clausii]|uniref:GNAT family N-acetyltransferase n=1 Tax=Shouchella clausii TaxID=79880 RepID=UPI003983C860
MWVGVNDFTSFKQKQETLLNETLTDPSYTIYVAKEEEAVVGYIALREHLHYFTEEKQGYVAALVVASEHEGKNVGKRLLAKGEQWAKDHGYACYFSLSKGRLSSRNMLDDQGT